jgi:TetR/AcrR family transcriptional regulator
MKRDRKTEEIIMNAALIVFQRKGMAGARMQEIADEAGLNKSLLHYYYRSKEKLFEEVLSRSIADFGPQILNIINSDMTIEEKITNFIETYINHFLKAPFIPLFIMHEISQNPEFMINVFYKEHKIGFGLSKFQKQIEDEIQKGNLKNTSAIDLFVNMIALAAFPFVGKTLIQTIANVDDKNYFEFIESRKKSVPALILNGILK